MTYYIKLHGEDKYIWTEIDSGGMSAWLSSKKDDADRFHSLESATSFVKRLAEPTSKFRDDRFEIVQ